MDGRKREAVTGRETRGVKIQGQRSIGAVRGGAQQIGKTCQGVDKVSGQGIGGSEHRDLNTETKIQGKGRKITELTQRKPYRRCLDSWLEANQGDGLRGAAGDHTTGCENIRY